MKVKGTTTDHLNRFPPDKRGFPIFHSRFSVPPETSKVRLSSDSKKRIIESFSEERTPFNAKRKPSLHGKAGSNIVSPRTLPAKSYPVSEYRGNWIMIPLVELDSSSGLNFEGSDLAGLLTLWFRAYLLSPSRPLRFRTVAWMKAFVATYSSGAVAESHRLPSCVRTDTKSS